MLVHLEYFRNLHPSGGVSLAHEEVSAFAVAQVIAVGKYIPDILRPFHLMPARVPLTAKWYLLVTCDIFSSAALNLNYTEEKKCI